MGERLTLRLYKGGSTSQFKTHIAHAALMRRGKVVWNVPGDGEQALHFWSDGLHHAIHVPHHSNSGDFVSTLGMISDLPWFELRIQEGSLWDYAFYLGNKDIDLFSTMPEYWEDPDDPGFAKYVESWKGNASLIARVWSIPVDRIDQYLKHWGHIRDEENDTFRTVLKGKAYPTDRFEYGDIWQVLDFLNALGGRDPFDGYEHHTLKLPPIKR